ncbi:hypothetical protein CRM22_010485 [Opisthorchis felineus]|uniref:Cystatin domain-containing protein n=2 Tax=Opisthorchis felineus TaxID=147828 RepID=A0A4S2L3L3_OPIFE|nr:hypothetical protein CRM22_010485 [Opisthorchis felineus]
MWILRLLLLCLLAVSVIVSKPYLGEPLELTEDVLRSHRIANLTRLAVERFNRQSDEFYWYVQREVSGGRKWLFKGAVYELNVVLQPSGCSRTAVLLNLAGAENCTSRGNAVNVTCTFLAWQRLWGNHSVAIDILECLRADELEISSRTQEFHKYPGKSIGFTRIYQEIINDIGEQLKKKSQMPSDARYTEDFCFVENETKDKMAVLEYRWNRTGCPEEESPNFKECYGKLPKDTLLTCAAEFEWPYRVNESWLKFPNCSWTPLVSLEDELYSVGRLSNSFNMRFPIVQPRFTERKLSWHIRQTEEEISLQPQDQVWMFPLINQAYQKKKGNSWYNPHVEEVINLRRLVEPTEVLQFTARLYTPHTYEKYIFCNMTFFVENQTIQVKDCENKHDWTPKFSGPLSEDEKSQPWFIRMMDLLTEQFSEINPLETPFALSKVEHAVKRLVREDRANTTLLQLTVNFKSLRCQSAMMYSTCDSDKENIICDVVVRNSTSMQPETALASLSDCWHSVKLPMQSVTRWISLHPEQITEPKWRDRLKQAVQVHNNNFIDLPDYTHYYASDVHITASSSEAEDTTVMFQLNLEMQAPVKVHRSCQVVIKESPGKTFDFTVYNCEEEYFLTGKKLSPSFRPMRKTEETAEAFVRLKKLAEAKANLIMTDTYFYHKLSHIQESKIKNDGTPTVAFEMVLLRTDCNRVNKTNRRGDSNCAVQDFATAIICDVRARSLSWLYAFHYVEVTNCHFVAPKPPHLNLPPTYLDIMAAETTFPVILKQVEVEFNKMNTDSKYYGLITVEDISNRTSKTDLSSFVTFKVTLQPTNWEKKNANIFAKSDDIDKKNHNLVSCHVIVRTLAHEQAYELNIFGCNETRLLNIQSELQALTENENDHLWSVAKEATGILTNYSSENVTFLVHRIQLLDREKFLGDRVTFNLYLWWHWWPSILADAPYTHKRFIVCRVTHWIRTFPRKRKTLDIRGCYSLERRKHSNLHEPLSHEEFRKYNLDPLLPRFSRLISGKIGSRGPLKIEGIFAYGQIPVSGEKFDFYANLRPESIPEQCTNISTGATAAGQCSSFQGFLQCHCTVASQPWTSGVHELEVVQCKQISNQSVKKATEDPVIPFNITLANVNRFVSAMNSLRQNIFPKDKVTYGAPEVRRIEKPSIAGQGLEVTLDIQPNKCDDGLTVTECDFWRYSHYIECKLIGHYVNWNHAPSIHLTPHACQKVLNQSDSVIKQILLAESGLTTNRNDSISTETKKSKLSIHVEYAITTLEDITTEYKNGRLVTFNVTLQAQTCINTLPLRNDTQCSDWLPKGYVACRGQMFEGLQVDSQPETKLFDCHQTTSMMSSLSTGLSAASTPSPVPVTAALQE